MRRNTIEDFWHHVYVDAPTECWPWLGSLDKDGYGLFRFKWQMWRAHRLAWVDTSGPVPDGLNVLHSCDNPICCNPDHLFLGTNLDNVRDKMRKGRFRNGGINCGVAIFQRAKTHCPHGHAYAPENTYYQQGGHRVCKTCHAVRKRNYRLKMRDRLDV